MSDGERESTWRFEIPANMTVYYLRLLKKGPQWTAEETPELQRLQAAHVAYGHQLLEAGTLVLNGPLLDDVDLRGVGVFRVGSLAEAQALSDADPAVQAGRLVSEIHPWMVSKGILPN